MPRTGPADKMREGTTRADRTTDAKARRLLWKNLGMPGVEGSHRGVTEMKLENRGQRPITKSPEWFAKTTEVSLTSKTELWTSCQYNFFFKCLKNKC